MRGIGLWAVGVWMVAVVGGCAGARAGQAPPAEHFSIATYNINWGGPRPDLSLEAILHADADIVCLQETNEPWEEYLAPRLQEAYAHRMFRHASAAGGMAVFSRWPVREVLFERPGAGWFGAWVLEAETPCGTVQIVAVHLRPPLSDQGTVSVGPYLASGDIHRQEMEEIGLRWTSGRPTIILGDFNEGDGGGAVGWAERKGFADALRQYDPHSLTWHWPVGLITLKDRYDHILHTRELRCYDARVIKEGASDHFPVVGVFAKEECQTSNATDERR